MVERVQDLRKLPPLPEKQVAAGHHPTLSDQVGKKGGSGEAVFASAVVRPQDRARNWQREPTVGEVPKDLFEIKPLIKRDKEVEVLCDEHLHEIKVIVKGKTYMRVLWLPQGRIYDIYRDMTMPGGASAPVTYHGNFQEVFTVCRQMGVKVWEIMHTMVDDPSSLIQGWDYERCPERSNLCAFKPTNREADKPIFQCTKCEALFEYNEDQTLSLWQQTNEQAAVTDAAQEMPPFTAYIDQIRGMGKKPNPKVSELLAAGHIDSWGTLFKATYEEMVKIKGIGAKRAELLMYWAKMMEDG